MKVMKIFAAVVCCVGFTGCTHIADLMACRPPQKSPEPFTDAGGWDHRSVDDVRCSNEALKAVQLAREKREAETVLR